MYYFRAAVQFLTGFRVCCTIKEYFRGVYERAPAGCACPLREGGVFLACQSWSCSLRGSGVSGWLPAVVWLLTGGHVSCLVAVPHVGSSCCPTRTLGIVPRREWSVPYVGMCKLPYLQLLALRCTSSRITRSLYFWSYQASVQLLALQCT